MADAATTDPLNFDCPRCGAAVSEEFYGPCGACRIQLRQAVAAAATATAPYEAKPFEPKMHVTPNAVALKDD